VPQGRFGQVRKISPLPGFDPRTIHPVASRFTNYATRPTMSLVHVSILHATEKKFVVIYTEEPEKPVIENYAILNLILLLVYAILTSSKFCSFEKVRRRSVCWTNVLKFCV
jgi:hypothetical protein